MTAKSEFYEAIGEVTELAQCLELELGTILLVAEADENKWHESPIDNAQAYEALLGKVNKKTLGGTLRQIQTRFGLLDSFAKVMEEAVSARNRFTHHIFREFGLAPYTPEGRTEMLITVTQLRATMQIAYDVASEISPKMVLDHVAKIGKNS